MARVTTFHLSGDQPDKLIPFYRDTFGWVFRKTDNPTPTWFVKTGDSEQAGIDGMLHTREHDSAVVNTIEIDDMDAVIARVEERGGRVLDRRTIPQAGEIALFEDPEHNVFQLRRPPADG